MNWRALLVGVLLALPIAFQSEVAEAALAVRSIVVVPTPAGNLDLRHLDGDDGTAEIPLAWASMSDHANEIEGTAASYPLCANLTQPGGPNATVTLVGAPTGWSVTNPTDAGCTLSYSGTGTAAATSTIARATRGADVSDSLPFLLGATAPDTDTCITGFTCASFSGADCDFEALDSNTQEITHTGPGACATYKTFSGEPNRNFAVDIKSGATFNDADFSGGGAFLMGGTDWETSYLTQLWWPKTGRARLRTNDNATALSQNCAAATSLSQGVRILYEAATDDQSGWESEDNSTYTQCGNAVDDGPITSGFYGVYVQGSTDLVNPTTMTFDIITDSTTLPGGGPPDPPDPPPSGFQVTNLSGGPAWPSGVGQIPNNGAYFSWQTWAGGRKIDAYTTWVGSNDGYGAGGTRANWKDGFDSPYFTQAFVNTAADPTITIILREPMLPHDVDPGTPGDQNAKDCNAGAAAIWDDAAAGEFDADIQTLAGNLAAFYRARRPNDPTGKHFVLSWGWEMNGSWYAWSICGNVAEFKAYWNRSIPIFRQYGLADMGFDLSPAQNFLQCTKNVECSPKIKLEDMLPNDANYDFISKSHHNNFPTITSDADFQAQHINTTQRTSLPHLREVAIAHGKRFSLTEWATELADCGGNSPGFPSAQSSRDFYEGTYAFLASSDPDDIGWDTVFQTGCHRLDNRPTNLASITFNNLWNGQ